MRQLGICVLVTTLVACGGAQPEPAVREVPAYSIEQFLGTVDYRGGSFSPDGSKILVSSDSSGIYNVQAVPVDGGEPVALTASTTDSLFAISYFPEDERFLYQSDRGGNENTHVFVRELDGTTRDLTPGERVKAVWHGWAADGRSFFLGVNDRDPRFFDIYEYSAADYSRSRIYRDDTGYQLATISRDKRYLAFDKPRTTSDSDIWLHDRESGETKLVSKHEGPAVYSAVDFDPDGSHLYFLTNDGDEFLFLARRELAGGTVEEVVRPRWDVVSARFSRGGNHLVVTINADARTEVRVYDAAGREPVALPEMPVGDITGVRFSDDERKMLFYLGGARNPGDLYVLDLGGGAPRQLTRSLDPEIAAEDLVEGRVVRFASYDDLEIPGILYRPHQASSEHRVPALVWVHGGPGGQSRLGYHALLQYLVNHGYAVFAINNRGSSGYGKTFHRMDDRRHGDVDLKDCLASRRMLVNSGWVDPGKIGIIGGSYGGYMVLAALAFEPNEFAVGVDIFGVANWVRTLESVPPYWESFREALYREIGDPAEDAERLRRISPLFHADRIRRPLMVLQGANDPRVLKVESDEMVAAARANGATVEYLVFDDEGHGFRKKDNRLRGYRAILEFLDRHLGPAPV